MNDDLQKIKQEFFAFESEIFAMKQELILKRRQVEQLRKDIDTEKIKNHDLSRTLDAQKHKIEETTKNLNIAMQNNQLLDAKLQGKIEESNKIKLQYELVVIESKTLRELLHKSELEKFDLLHKMEDLEEQNKRLQVFQKQMNCTDQKVMDFIAKTKKEIDAVEKKINNMVELTKELKLSKQLYEQLIFERSKVKRLESENQRAEKQVTEVEAKYKKLKEILENHKFLFSDGVDLLKLQYDQCLENHKNDLEFFKNSIKDFTEKLQLEKEANNLLMLKNEDNCKVIDELNEALKKKMDVREVEIQTDEIEVKQEQKDVIEID